MFNDEILFETKDKRIVVKETRFQGEPVRILLVNEVGESAVFYDEGRKSELVFDYLKEFAKVFDVRPDLKNTLLLGGAGFTFPRHITERYKDVHMDVCEIDPLMIDLAKKFFFLENYDPATHGEIIVDDALKYIKRCKKKYDAVFHDAYTENIIEEDLLSESGIRAVKKVMSKKGVYVINMISAFTGKDSLRGIMARAMLREHFKNVSWYPANESIAQNKPQNSILVASDGEIGPIRGPEFVTK